MALEFYVREDGLHAFAFVVDGAALAESTDGFPTLGAARRGASRLLPLLLDSDLPAVSPYVQMWTRARSVSVDPVPGLRLVPAPRIG